MYLRTAVHSSLANQHGLTSSKDVPSSGSPLSVKARAVTAWGRKPASFSSISALSRVKVSTDRLVQRRKKKVEVDASQDDDSDKKSNYTGTNHEDTYSSIDYFDEDFNFDSDEDDHYEASDARGFKTDDVSTQAYLAACKALKVVPAMFIARNLTGEEIVMQNHPIGPVGVKACAIALVKNASVKKLDIKGAEMGPKGAVYIADMLQENIFLTELMLAENHLGSEGLEALTDVLEKHTSVRKLDLSGNNFGEGDAVYFVRILENIHIRQLILNHNNFREKGGITLSTAIASNDTLEELDLSWNHLRWKGAQAICQGLKENTSLKSVNLSWNGFHIQGCTAMAETLKQNETLLELDLSCNRIDRTCLQKLLEGVKLNVTLEKLKLCFNPVSSDGAMDILNVLEGGKDHNLKEISFSTQAVREDFIDKLEKILKACPSLVVKHGVILHNYLDTSFDEMKFIMGDPMIILMECMRLRNLRLVDLFQSLDEDGSGTLTRQEFSKGLEAVNLPLSREMIEDLIDRLDTDGDGEVDFAELVYGQKEHKKKMYRIMQKNKNVPPEENSILLLSKRLEEMMNERFLTWERKKKFSRAVRRASILNLANEEKNLNEAPIASLPLLNRLNNVDTNGDSDILEEDDDDMQKSKKFKILLRGTSKSSTKLEIE